jgi:hypothetical protein
VEKYFWSQTRLNTIELILNTGMDVIQHIEVRAANLSDGSFEIGSLPENMRIPGDFSFIPSVTENRCKLCGKRFGGLLRGSDGYLGHHLEW